MGAADAGTAWQVQTRAIWSVLVIHGRVNPSDTAARVCRAKRCYLKASMAHGQKFKTHISAKIPGRTPGMCLSYSDLCEREECRVCPLFLAISMGTSEMLAVTAPAPPSPGPGPAPPPGDLNCIFLELSIGKMDRHDFAPDFYRKCRIPAVKSPVELSEVLTMKMMDVHFHSIVPFIL